MATTTNYGWTTPDDTALVKDGAAAIRTLGSSVDTTTKALNPSTTLGDVEYRSSTANTNTRLGIGTTGQVLTVSGGVPAWSTISVGGMTLLSTTTLSTSSVNISGIDGSYNNLLIIINGATTATATVLRAQANGSTTLSKIAGYDAVDVGPLTNVIGTLATTTSTSQTAFLLLNNYANTSYNKIGNFGLSTNTGNVHSFGTYLYQSTSAISSITITNSTTVAFTGGQVLIYGVK